LKFSKLGLIAKESGFIPNFQIEAIRLFLRRLLKKRAQIFFRIFPNQPITKKPNEVRLGRGKGNFKY
jgi:large subunit ribosomal protein L16